MGVSIGQPRLTGQLKRPKSGRMPLEIDTDLGLVMGGRNNAAMMNRTGTVRNNFVDPDKIISGPPDFTYASFAGTPSIS